jgi:uncharacterized membrane protein
VTELQWLLALHVTGAFLFLGGAVVAGALNVAAQRAARPSEIALFLALARFAVIAIAVGALLSLVLGLWLVHDDAGFSYGQTWIVLALILFVVALGAGQVGGRRDRQTRELAERLAAASDQPSDELRTRLRDPLSLVLSWGSGAAVVAILALMIWKPGA